MSFSPFDLERAARLTGGDLDALPFGVIVIDAKGNITEYNSYEASMAQLPREKVLGRNFFHDVAPCTALQEFEGRFNTFLTSENTSVEPFQFVFPFTRGPQRVSVVFVRSSTSSEYATICVLRMGDVSAEAAIAE